MFGIKDSIFKVTLLPNHPNSSLTMLARIYRCRDSESERKFYHPIEIFSKL
jgi:hypothetical protein